MSASSQVAIVARVSVPDCPTTANIVDTQQQKNRRNSFGQAELLSVPCIFGPVQLVLPRLESRLRLTRARALMWLTFAAFGMVSTTTSVLST